jgi:mannose-6-phosphate isomerase-like protein (cupin superfamily)
MRTQLFSHSWLLLLALLAFTSPVAAQTAEETAADTIEDILQHFAQEYHGLGSDTCAYVVQFDVGPADQSWHAEVFPDGHIELAAGASDHAAFVFATDEAALRDIYHERMTGFTAAAQATGLDAVPLEVRTTEAAAQLGNPHGALLGFTQDFFNRTWPERIQLGEEHSRVVHGAHAIPLYYGQGFRSAWYMVKKGQRLNEPGDTNPFPQAFVIISGDGMAKIGDSTIKVSAGESYYIPPGSDHVLWTESEDGITLIWLGWGEGA